MIRKFTFSTFPKSFIKSSTIIFIRTRNSITESIPKIALSDNSTGVLSKLKVFLFVCRGKMMCLKD